MRPLPSGHGPASLRRLPSPSPLPPFAISALPAPPGRRNHPAQTQIPDRCAIRAGPGTRHNQRAGDAIQFFAGGMRQQGVGRRRGRRPLGDPARGGGGGGLGSGGEGDAEPVDTWQKGLLVGIAASYVTLVVLLPFANVFLSAFAKGVGPFVENVLDPDFLHAMKMTLILAAICVPLNTLFGVVAAVKIARNDFFGKSFLISLLDLPFSISPVVVGLMLVLLYGREGLFAPILREYGFTVVFAFPGMVLATLFVTLPFVARELIPLLEGLDPAEEEAARTLGANDLEVFFNVTLPNIKWGLLYGVILTNARAVGEFGAISVISGNIIGQTQTLTLFVESAYKEYNTEGAYAASVLLSTIALLTLVLKGWLERIAARERGEA